MRKVIDLYHVRYSTPNVQHLFSRFKDSSSFMIIYLVLCSNNHPLEFCLAFLFPVLWTRGFIASHMSSSLPQFPYGPIK